MTEVINMVAFNPEWSCKLLKTYTKDLICFSTWFMLFLWHCFILCVCVVVVFFTSTSDGLRYEHSQPLHSVHTVQVRESAVTLAWMWLWTNTNCEQILCLFACFQMCNSQCLHDPAAPGRSNASSKALQSHKRRPQQEEGHHGRHSRRPGEQGKVLASRV